MTGTPLASGLAVPGVLGASPAFASTCDGGLGTVSGSSCTVTMTSSGSFTVPVGTTSLPVMVDGAAGKAGNASGSYSGGSGDQVSTTLGVTAGSTLTVHVGSVGGGDSGGSGTGGEGSGGGGSGGGGSGGGGSGGGGGVFSFGDAGSGSPNPSFATAGPVVGSSLTADHRGYWLASSAGGVYTFGDAGFFGSIAGTPLSWWILRLRYSPLEAPCGRDR